MKAGVHRSARKPLLSYPIVLACILAMTLSLVVASPAAAEKPRYKVKLTFTQSRPFTYYRQQTNQGGESCTVTDQSEGSDEATLHGKGQATSRGEAGMVVEGEHTRAGTATHSVHGDCAGNYYFPSSHGPTVVELDGSKHATEPTTGCGTQPSGDGVTIERKGGILFLTWTLFKEIPEFEPCPWFDGSDEAGEDPGEIIPSASRYWNVDIHLTGKQKKRLRSGADKVVVRGSEDAAGTETCANSSTGCGEGISYTATGSLRILVELVYTRTN